MTLGCGDFVGQWRLSRTIRDQLAGRDGTLVGTAQFTADGQDALIYDEQGLLTLGQGAQMEATRRYLWTFTDGAVAVRFDDGRDFHRFTPEGHAAGTDHPCGADFYTVRYDFFAWPCWSAVWAVKGPRKNYVSTSVYTR